MALNNRDKYAGQLGLVCWSRSQFQVSPRELTSRALFSVLNLLVSFKVSLTTVHRITLWASRQRIRRSLSPFGGFFLRGKVCVRYHRAGCVMNDRYLNRIFKMRLCFLSACVHACTWTCKCFLSRCRLSWLQSVLWRCIMFQKFNWKRSHNTSRMRCLQDLCSCVYTVKLQYIGGSQQRSFCWWLLTGCFLQSSGTFCPVGFEKHITDQRGFSKSWKRGHLSREKL